MAVTDLTNTTWLWNNQLTRDGSYVTYNINFVSNNTNYTSLALNLEDNEIGYNDTEVYGYPNTWRNEAYRTITFTGGTDVTNTGLISRLEANATQQTPSDPEVINTTIKVGTKALANAFVGINKLIKAYSGNHLIFERLGGNFLTSDGKVFMTSDNKVFNVQEASGYSVSVHVTESDLNDKNYLRIYDGQDTSGTLLHESTTSVSGQTLNLICTSGYLYISASGSSVNLQITDIVGDIIRNGYVMTISSNGSFSLLVDYDF